MVPFFDIVVAEAAACAAAEAGLAVLVDGGDCGAVVGVVGCGSFLKAPSEDDFARPWVVLVGH